MNDLIDEIERLNLEVINLQQSREYRIGKKILHFKKLVKKMSIKKIIFKLKNTRKMEKLIKGQFIENKNYSYLKENANININKNIKILVYTCITGNYDNPAQIYLKESCCDYKLNSSILTLMPRSSRRRFMVMMLPRSLYRLRMSGYRWQILSSIFPFLLIRRTPWRRCACWSRGK